MHDFVTLITPSGPPHGPPAAASPSPRRSAPCSQPQRPGPAAAPRQAGPCRRRAGSPKPHPRPRGSCLPRQIPPRVVTESRSARRRQEALHLTRADVALQRPRRRFEQPRAKLRAEAWRAHCRRLQPSNDRPVQTLIRPKAETTMPNEGHSCAPDSRPARLLNRGVEWVMLDHSQRRRQFVVHARPFRHSGNLDRQSRPIIRHLLG